MCLVCVLRARINKSTRHLLQDQNQHIIHYTSPCTYIHIPVHPTLKQVSVHGARATKHTNKHNYPCKKGSGRLTLTYSKQWLTLPDPFVHGQMCMLSVGVQCNVGMSMLRGTGVYGVHEYVRRERVHEIVLGVIHSQQFRQVR